jgi:hypothetical protein
MSSHPNSGRAAGRRETRQHPEYQDGPCNRQQSPFHYQPSLDRMSLKISEQKDGIKDPPLALYNHLPIRPSFLD